MQLVLHKKHTHTKKNIKSASLSLLDWPCSIELKKNIKLAKTKDREEETQSLSLFPSNIGLCTM